MKIEIVIGDRVALLRQRAEVLQALRLLDLALEDAPAAPIDDSVPQLDAEELDKLLFNQLPEKFGIADVIKTGSTISTIPVTRGGAKGFLDRWEKRGAIRVSEKGTGRRATTYCKEIASVS